jgi:hypothetical protein
MTSTIRINNMTVSGRNVTIQNGKIIVDGKTIDTGNAPTIQIHVEGNIDTLQVDACEQISVQGNAQNVVTMSGDVTCNDVHGSVTTMSGDVRCKNVSGKIKTMSGDVRHD